MGGSKKSGGGGGGGMMDVPRNNLPTNFGGTGPVLPRNPGQMGSPATGQGTTAPDWMSGWFAAPWWGQPAPNVGATLLQRQDPRAYAQMQGLQSRRKPPNRRGDNRPKPKRDRRAKKGKRAEDSVYQGPHGDRGPTGFLDYGPFGGRQK